MFIKQGGEGYRAVEKLITRTKNCYIILSKSHFQINVTKYRDIVLSDSGLHKEKKSTEIACEKNQIPDLTNLR